MATTVIINATEQYIYRSEKSLTGTTVTSNQPIFVVSGISDMSDLAEILVEHVIPEHALGKHYVFFVPFDGSTVHVIVYCKYILSVDALFLILFVVYTASEVHVVTRCLQTR